MDCVGIIGAGQMGAGIAQVAAQAGYRVLLSDREVTIAEKAKARIAKRLGSAVEKGKLAADDAEAALGLIETVGDYAAFGDAFLVIEAATEREEIKRAIFADVGAVMMNGAMAGDAILASNTSSIPITRLAQAAPDPARFMGVHFFNPVPVMKLHRQPRAAADAQRGDLRIGRGRGECARHRCRRQPRPQSSDGAADAGGFHRARYLPRNLPRALHRHG
jgi:3-hydroxybutyryl-CoA dehydrogenase